MPDQQRQRPLGQQHARLSRTVYLREADLLPHLDGWLTGLFETPAEPSKLWAPSGLFPTAEDRARQDEQRGAEPARRVRGVRGVTADG